MSNIVEFIAKIGELGAHPCKNEIIALSKIYEITSEELETVLSGDSELVKLLDARENVYAILFPAEDDDSEESDDSDGGDTEENVAA